MLRIGRGLFGFLAAALACIGPALPLMPARGLSAPSPRRYRSRGKAYAPNGKREIARRLRQIAAGQLRVSQ
jgi:hypothetical protein